MQVHENWKLAFSESHGKSLNLISIDSSMENHYLHYTYAFYKAYKF